MMVPEKHSQASAWAVVPEQLICYVRSTTQAVPVRLINCLGYEAADNLILIGYPLQDPLNHHDVQDSLTMAMKSTRAGKITLLSSYAPSPDEVYENWLFEHRDSSDSRTGLDQYLSLALPVQNIPQKVRNLIRRAGREVNIQQGRNLEKQHFSLIEQYLKHRQLNTGTRHIFRNIGKYLQDCPGALAVSAWTEDNRLAGFSIGDYTGLETAFYMFSFRNPDTAPPGTADMLLHELLTEGAKRGHRRMNLGLNVNPAIAFFKKKWKAQTFLPYVETTWTRRPGGWLATLWQRVIAKRDKLLTGTAFQHCS